MKKAIFSLFFFGILVSPCTFADIDNDTQTFLSSFLSGRYTVIGKHPDSSDTYVGSMEIRRKDNKYMITRRISGITIGGEGAIETALGNDGALVFRVRYTQNNQNFEITYTWHSDLDNYPRLSGYVYSTDRKTKDPGLETLFIERSR